MIKMNSRRADQILMATGPVIFVIMSIAIIICSQHINIR